MDKWLFISSIGGSISSAGCLLFAALAYFKSNSTQSNKLIRCLIFMSAAILLLSIALVLSLLSVKNDKTNDTENNKKVDTVFVEPDQNKRPLLVFAGGGSVSNMITTKYSVEIKDYEKSIYLDLPSTNAWPLLAEEVMINHTSDSVTNKFYPICLSALKANNSVFHKIVDSCEFTEKGTVISYRLGNDNLKIYTSENIGEELEVSIDELSSKIKKWCIDKSVDIFITQEGSGTYLTYKNLLKDSIDIDTCKKVLKWYDTKLKNSNLPDRFIVLSSTYYTPEDVRSNRKGKKVMNKNGRVTLSKEIYLYFAGYREEVDSKVSGTTYIVIPKEMVEFLKKINKDNAANIKTKMYQRRKGIITPLDTLIRWEKENNITK